MGKRIVLTVTAFLGLIGSGQAADLLNVPVGSHYDAQALRATGAAPVLRTTDGYLVLVDAQASELLAESGLEFTTLATGIEREQLALDIWMDGSNIGKYPMLYQEDGLRLVQVDPAVFEDPELINGLAPIRAELVRILYKEPVQLRLDKSVRAADLDSLVGLIEQDSLESYTLALQAFPPRVTGSASDYNSRDWCYNKFVEFGYDSVYLDSFTYSSSNVQNIVLVKPGTTFPDHHIVVGAHKDAVSGSPGADDNGCGSAAVLEMARVLKDVETNMTFIFILFTGEEQGLNGSYHYASQAALNGDSIVVMFNMDMIAHYQNSGQSKLYHGTETAYAALWQDLADSLTGINISGVLSGTSGGSDHYPFQQSGYDVVFLHEYIFSTVYHSYQDSTTYMNFDYMTRMTKASLATVYQVNEVYVPAPALVFNYPTGVPQMFTPGVPETLVVQIEGSSGGQMVPASGKLWYAVDGRQPIGVSLWYAGGGLYEGAIPGQACDSRVEFYFSADEATSGTFYDPDTANPFIAVVATDMTVVFDDNFQTDQGWTVSGNATDGQWDRGVPVGGGDRGDPPTDYDGSGMCYLTDNVDDNSDVDGGTTSLTSPLFDLSSGDALIQYARWYSNSFGSDPFNDVFRVFISNNNGGSWTIVDSAGPSEQASGGWFEHGFWVSDFVAPTAQMRMRFDASDLGSGSVVEAGLDDFSVTTFSCEGYAFYVETETLPDWSIDVVYSQQLTAAGGTGQLVWTDKYGDLDDTTISLSQEGLVWGWASDTGLISFTALVTDELDSTAEKSLSFRINSAVQITTVAMANGQEGESYSLQMNSTGGTGVHNWTDKNNELGGWGLSLSSSGLVYGTPTSSGTVSFTAHAEDEIGSFDEVLFSFSIAPAFICGDVDGDGDGPVVTDLSYLVDYLFRSGPPPPVMDAADMDASGDVVVVDLTILVDYLFRGGPDPVCP